MALVKCSECSREISSTAKACPGCGEKPKKSVSMLGYVIAGFLLFIIFSLIGKSNDPTPPKSTLTPEQQAAHDKDLRNQSARISNTIKTQRSVKESLRDPKSVEWVSSEASEDGSVVCLVYRARNGFGGMNVERAAMANQSITMNSKAWEQNCVGKRLFPQ